MVKEAKGNHVALVVEDDPEMAEEVKDLLRSLGHDAVSVPSQEEAMNLLDAGHFCFVLLDLQIKTAPDSIKARVEAGKTLLRVIRERFPNRNREDHHHLQILVMSGYAMERHDVIQCLQDGADDFIIKPLDNNTPRMPVKIDECLRKSCRKSHKDCAVVMNAARHASQVSNALTQDQSLGVTLSITGELQGKRMGIVVDGKPLFLPYAQFLLLMKLVTNRVQNGHGWIHKTGLGSRDGEGFKGLSNLNATIQPFLPGGISFYENDMHGRYRMHTGIAVGKIDHDCLAGYWCKDLQMLSSEIQRLHKL